MKGGNHGSEPWLKRTPAKQRARRNYDWFIGLVVRKMLAGDQRITWHIDEVPQSIVPVYGTWYPVEHSDDIMGGGSGYGIAGIWPGLFRGIGNRQQSYASVGRSFDVALMGHWHQSIYTPRQKLIINGSLKGHDEYAVKMGFTYQRAEQIVWQTTPERGPTLSTVVDCQHEQSEGWQRSEVPAWLDMAAMGATDRGTAA